MRSLFFTGHISDHVVLDGDSGHHAADVVRLKVGEEIDVSDRIRLVRARVTAVHVGRVEAEIVEELALPQNRPAITVAQALIKGDGLVDSVDLMTQVGVHEVIPWQAERSIVQWDQAKAERNIAKLQVTAIEASKQSRRAIWPLIDGLSSTNSLLLKAGDFQRVVVLHESGSEHLADDDFDVDSLLLIVGPEGGLTPTELEQFSPAADIRRLGPTVIRSAQAGAIGAAVIFAKTSWRHLS